MTMQEKIRWGLGFIFWGLALMVFLFNIRRQILNQRYKDEGQDRHISGVVALTTVFTMIGVAASPWSWNGFWYLIILLEIPGLINFIEDKNNLDQEE